jgi:hypothetical protein
VDIRTNAIYDEISVEPSRRLKLTPKNNLIFRFTGLESYGRIIGCSQIIEVIQRAFSCAE